MILKKALVHGYRDVVRLNMGCFFMEVEGGLVCDSSLLLSFKHKDRCKDSQREYIYLLCTAVWLHATELGDVVVYLSLQEMNLSDLTADALKGAVAVNSKVEHTFFFVRRYFQRGCVGVCHCASVSGMMWWRAVETA